jgi:hypothetical protein
MTSTMLIAQEAQNIEKQLNQGSVRSYYSDNKLLGLINPAQEGEVSLQKFLTQNYLIDYSVLGRDVDQDEIGWYTHTGVSGWLFILNWYSLPIYLFFVLLLTVTPYLISARFIRAPTLIPVLHVASIFYVFHGWFGVQVGFILGLITYILLLSLVRGARFKKQGSCEGNIFLVEHRISKVHPQASSAE